MSTMATLASPRKITFAEMRESGARGLLVYCADYCCSHSITVSADRWPDEVQLSDISPRFTCTSRGNLRRTGCTVPPFTSIAEHRERRMAYESIPRLLALRDILHRQSPQSLTGASRKSTGRRLLRRKTLVTPSRLGAGASPPDRSPYLCSQAIRAGYRCAIPFLVCMKRLKLRQAAL
jgi:hypothetical protein